ncbi:hypothetical protein [Pseudidiomarina sediminum]|uniref:hypothetical protein n=1 Tax=Pseudidiomarina sediminum TaxID=431675 RepID=UPI001C9822A8|nr:hypothetical protein [Pseudidiomarina sediminum]MBY6062809.1 hypothetical protein [Pseudidiomarina sediminum]
MATFMQGCKAMLRRLGLWFVAAGITLAVLFVAVLVYQLTVYQPELPKSANCTALQTLMTDNQAAQLYLYQCQRGDDASWHGHEVWLEKRVEDEWQRLLTVPLEEGCLRLGLEDLTTQQRLTIYHQGSRGGLSLATSSVVYELPDTGARTISIATERVANCGTD